MTVSAGSPQRVTWGFVWLLAALCVGVPGWLLFALSDRPDGRVTGRILLGVAVLTGAVGSSEGWRRGESNP